MSNNTPKNVETFMGEQVPTMPKIKTQEQACHYSLCDECDSECKTCLFDYERPETLPKFSNWLEERNGR